MKRIRLSDVPQAAAYEPGTKSTDVRPATIKKWQDTTRSMQKKFGGDVYLEDITREMYSEWHEWINDGHRKAITVNGYRRRGRAIWNRLEKNGYRVCDITGITRDEAEPTQASKAITDNHLEAILQLASVRDAAMILFLVHLGVRRQTIPRLTLGNVRVWYSAVGSWRIAAKIPHEKTSPPRLVMAKGEPALAVELWLRLRRFKESPWLFYNMHDGSQLDDPSVNTVFYNLRQRANIPGWSNVTAHSLRHRYAQDMLDEHDAKMVAQLMGISIDTMLKVYATRSEERLAKAYFGDEDYPDDLFTLGNHWPQEERPTT